MAAGNSQGKSPPTRPPITGEEFAPLAAASRGKPTGRVRSLEDARRELQIPTSADTDVLNTWGTPKDFQLAVYPVAEPDTPDRVAEFALLRVVKREGSELVAGKNRTRLRLAEKSNALWVVYGSIAIATDGSLVIESIAIGPAFEGQLGRNGDDIAHGVTGQLLRLLSPPTILAACAERLHVYGYGLDLAAVQGDRPMSAKHREHLKRIDKGRPRHAPVSDDHLADLAARYIVLYLRGNRTPRTQLAREFGLTRNQVRDRIHNARERGYLTAGTQGRAGAQPGPRLLARGSKLPEPTQPNVVNSDNNPGRPRRRRRSKHA